MPHRTAARLLVLALLAVAGSSASAYFPDDLPDKKNTEPAKPLLDAKGELSDNDPNDPVHNQPCKLYTVKLRKGTTYVIDMESEDFDSYLRLDDARGKQLAEDDDGGEELNAQIVHTATEDGQVKIVATRFADGGGKFTLKVTELKYQPGKLLALDKQGQATVEGKLDANDPKDPIGPKYVYKSFSVAMKAGRTYTVNLDSSAFDCYLRLVDGKFAKLAEDDDGGGDLNSRIIYRPKTDGVCHVIATTFDGDTGDFTLRVREDRGERKVDD